MNDALSAFPSEINPAEIAEADQLLCRLLNQDSDRATRLNGIDEEQWIEVLRCAEKHQLTSVLYYRLVHTPGWADLPDSVQSNLSWGHLIDDGMTVARQYRLGQVLRAFSQRGLAVIVLKGAFLAEVIYPHDSERRMNDFDLLIPKATIETAIETLRSLGYSTSLDHPAREDFSSHHHTPPFEQNGCPPVELHWDLCTPGRFYEINLEGVWQRAQPAVIASTPVLGLSPEDLLLHLCIHTAGHRLRGGLRSSYEIALTVDHYADKIDWAALTGRAFEWSAQRSVFLMLKLAKDLFGAPVPAAVLSDCQPDDYDPSLLSLAYQLVFHGGQAVQPLAINVVRLHTTPGLWNKLRILLRRFFPPVSEISHHFGVSRHSWRVWLYYLLRWRELFVEHFHRVWKLWRGDPLIRAQARADAHHLDQEEVMLTWLTSE